jgi:hypothetical protein
MSFTAEYLPYARQRYFTYYATGGSAADTGSTMVEEFAPSFAFMLDKIHLHLSSVHASVEDLMVHILHRANSYYDYDLLSQAMNGIKDVLHFPSRPLLLHSGDTVRFSMVYSAANHYGLEISGWAITVPVGGW